MDASHSCRPDLRFALPVARPCRILGFSDGQQKFVPDCVAAWNKVNADCYIA